MKDRNWQPPRRIERAYASAIKHLLKGLEYQLRGVSSPFLIVATIRRFARSPTFKETAGLVAKQMATNVFSDGHKNWRQAAQAGSKGRFIYEALNKELTKTATGVAYKAIIRENAKLIRSMPEDIARWTAGKIADQYAAGVRHEDIISDILERMPHMARSRAELIARTETSKASTALTRARSADVGLNWYVWRTSQDSCVRGSHTHMEGVVVNWNNPPSPETLIHQKSVGNYHAGDIWNCRCFPAPLILFEDIQWPAKVYYRGRIERMSLAKFKKLSGGEL